MATTITEPVIGHSYKHTRLGIKVTPTKFNSKTVYYALEPIWSNNNVIVFNHTCWIPKSVIVNDKNKGLTVKKWFETKFEGGPHIKKYFMKGDEKIFV